jgi:hypothetical protein
MFDELAKRAGFTKRSGSWYRRQADTISVLNLQKSQYGPSYYVNLGVWLSPLGDSGSPPPHHCHVQTRLEALAPESERNAIGEPDSSDIVIHRSGEGLPLTLRPLFSLVSQM